ncbi:hypothetical protein SDC9_182104 [bioreactor metagenome]|uniref:Uncharacterized protein n=1 Tax=bioreactor metagenome TaxID=1076179 RepID=A0A645H7F1_9ZZZZ
MSGQRVLSVEEHGNSAPLAGARNQRGIRLQIGNDNRHVAIANTISRKLQNCLGKGLRLRTPVARAKDRYVFAIPVVDGEGIRK